MIAIHIAFQLGFCTFVLSNYMKTLPQEMTEAAVVDGASVFQIYRKVIMPLVRPAFAALVVLETTWIYNDFFWALLLMKSGERMPITSALNSLKGNFFVDNNLIAAGAIIVGAAHDDRLLRRPEAVHQRPDPGLDEGLSAGSAVERAGAVGGLDLPDPGRPAGPARVVGQDPRPERLDGRRAGRD